MKDNIQFDEKEPADKVAFSGSTVTQSPFTPSYSAVPATLPQKKLLKEARELLDKDYPEADANEDEDVREHREKVLITLERMQGHKLNAGEGTQLKQIIADLKAVTLSEVQAEAGRMSMEQSGKKIMNPDAPSSANTGNRILPARRADKPLLRGARRK